MSSPVRVSRPLTAGGITGLKPHTSGVRQVKDAHYYRSLLKLRIREAGAEVDRMRIEIGDLQVVVRQSEELNKVQLALQLQIAKDKAELLDINAAIECLITGSHPKPTEVADIGSQITEEQRACESFLEAKTRLSAQLQTTQARFESLRDSWSWALGTESVNALLKDCGEARDRMRRVTEDHSQLQAAVSGNTELKERLRLQEAIAATTADKTAIQRQLEMFSKPVGQQREWIINWVKTTRVNNTELEDESRAVSAEIDAMQQTLAGIQRGNPVDVEKIRMLQAREAEMEDALRAFGIETADLRNRIASIRDKHEAGHQMQLLSVDLVNSRLTSAKLMRERDERKAEMARLGTVEATYVEEVSRVQAELDRVRSAITELSDVEQLKRDRVTQACDMESQLSTLDKKLQDMQMTCHAASVKLEGRKLRLTESRIHQELRALDEQASSLDDQVDAIVRRISSASFEVERRDLTRLVEQISGALTLDC